MTSRVRLGFTERFLRGMSAVVLVALVQMALWPFSRALALPLTPPALTAPAGDGAEDYAQALAALQADVEPDSAPGYRPQSTPDPAAALAALDAARARLEAEWTHLRQTWTDAGVALEILDRQRDLEAAFARRHADLIRHLHNADTAEGRAALAAFLTAQRPEPAAPPVDLHHLPWQVQKNQARPPLDDPEALARWLNPLPAPADADPRRAPLARVATAAPTAADLAETLDAPQTAAIQKLAADLGHNPHKIYQWVHDHIDFFPSYGSVHGAQDTLDKQSGNAFDQASLLIALLRAARIPARYVYGTVEMPAAQVMNWVGGVETPDAAQQLLGQGGIPNQARVAGGTVQAFRLEHVWVEAFIDYHPDRGAKHVGGQTPGDTWVAMDPSFKQYTFTAGMDLPTAVPFDAQGFLERAQQGATVNEAEGWVRNLNQATIQQDLRAYQQRLDTYLKAQKNGQATVGDVLGTQTARIDKLPYLAGTLPYSVKATAARFSEMPSSLRHQFRYRIFLDDHSRRIEAAPLLEFQAPTVSLAGKKLTLAWVAASAADQRAIEALLPKPHPDGRPIQPSELPTRLPASIHLKPQLRVEGEVQAEGPGLSVGSEPVGAGAFTPYAHLNDWDETVEALVAGQQSALGLSIQGISAAQLKTLKDRMDQTKATLERAQAAPENQRPAILQDLTGENLTGDLLIATIWGYFANHAVLGALSQPQARMIDRPGLSYGLFHLHAQPIKLYGTLTTRVEFKGLNLDIGHLRALRWSKVNDPPAWVAYNRLRGQQASALEHATPEAFWIDRTQCRYTDENGHVINPNLPDCPQAVSAVKAIAIAARQGQKIFTITSKNAAVALPQLSVSRSVAAEIRNAIATGKEVTVHEKPINAYGFSGVGYILVDPDTGSGAYLIEGGGSGALAFFLGIIIGSLLWASLEFATIAPNFLFVMIPFILLQLSLIIAAISFLNDFYRACFLQGIVISTIVAAGGMASGIFATGITQWAMVIANAAFAGPTLLGTLPFQSCYSGP